jgi:hypothetical protein
LTSNKFLSLLFFFVFGYRRKQRGRRRAQQKRCDPSEQEYAELGRIRCSTASFAFYGGNTKNTFPDVEIINEGFLIQRGSIYEHKDGRVVVINVQRLPNNKCQVDVVPSGFLTEKTTVSALKKRIKQIPQTQLGNYVKEISLRSLTYSIAGSKNFSIRLTILN